MKVAIIGAGWYGCHVALFLQKKGLTVDLYEKNNEIFSGMSGFNSNRLHKGFHYPRSYITRNNCLKSFSIFKKQYPNLTKKIKNNYIGIHNQSLIDFETYKQILDQSGLKYENISKNIYSFKNVEGFIKCDEELIDYNKSKLFFKSRIKNLITNHKINNIFLKKKKYYINEGIYDWILDCTACTLSKNYHENILYEPRITLLYESKLKGFACMLMDGRFWSIYPRADNFYTLGSVIHSRLHKITNKLKAKKIIDSLKKQDLKKIIYNFEQQVMRDFPDFKELFKYKGFYTSLTTIYNSSSDSRPLLVNKKNNLIEILGAKIDNVVEIEKILAKMIH